MGRELTKVTFDEWVSHIFQHPVTDPAWHFAIESDWWSGEPQLTVQYVTRLFEAPEFLISRFTRDQLEQGLWYLNGTGQPFMLALLDPEVPWPSRQRGLVSIGAFFEKFFARVCDDELGHLVRGNEKPTPVNCACYMWWDLFPCHGSPRDESRSAEDQTIIQVLREILQMPSAACRESSIHGLGHWQPSYPNVVERMIDDFLEQNKLISIELRDYALQARSGVVL